MCTHSFDSIYVAWKGSSVGEGFVSVPAVCTDELCEKLQLTEPFEIIPGSCVSIFTSSALMINQVVFDLFLSEVQPSNSSRGAVSSSFPVPKGATRELERDF